MKYVLILKTGKVMAFNVLACAELYLTIYGGTLIRETLELPETTTV
jgi:hypothetical protein